MNRPATNGRTADERQPIKRGTHPVLVVDDHELVAASLVAALRAEGLDAQRCASCHTGAVLATARTCEPGTVLLDLDLGDAGNGTDLVAPLRALGWSVLILTGMTHRARLGAAIAAGADGWASKTLELDALIAKVHALAAGLPVMSGAVRAELIAAYRAGLARAQRNRDRAADADTRLSTLSPREHEVLERLADGAPAGTIASEFVVSVATVRAQIRSILTKLDVSSQLAAAALLHHRASATRG